MRKRNTCAGTAAQATSERHLRGLSRSAKTTGLKRATLVDVGPSHERPDDIGCPRYLTVSNLYGPIYWGEMVCGGWGGKGVERTPLPEIAAAAPTQLLDAWGEYRRFPE